jgi:hypothetical protein
MSITSANAVIMLSLSPLFTAPVQLQQFAADNIFGTDPIDASETSMGVDGFLTGGFVNVPTRQSFHLQADSPSNYFFDQWYLQQKALQDTYIASGTIILRSLGSKFKMVRGFLKTYTPIPPAGRVLGPRVQTIEWQSAVPQPS